ncbi:hypothetical protein BDD12DRAFT_945539 [Trichophaea hybrida]|nr:hypothetical protein BDD12DRAFT_945539 [Trichophaea hybrida]
MTQLEINFSGSLWEPCSEDSLIPTAGIGFFKLILPTMMTTLFFLKEIHICWKKAIDDESTGDLAISNRKRAVIIRAMKAALRNVTTVMIHCVGIWLATLFTAITIPPIFAVGMVSFSHFGGDKIYSLIRSLVAGYIIYYSTESALALASTLIIPTGNERSSPLQIMCRISHWPAQVATSKWCPVVAASMGGSVWILAVVVTWRLVLRVLQKFGHNQFQAMDIPFVEDSFAEALYTYAKALSWIVTMVSIIVLWWFSGELQNSLIMLAVIIGFFVILAWFQERRKGEAGGFGIDEKDPTQTEDLERALLLPREPEKVGISIGVKLENVMFRLQC